MDADRAYANGDFIPGSDALPDQWGRAAAAYRDHLGDRALLGLAYGPAARQRFDLFLPITPPRGLLVWVHGGYWLAFGRETWSHFAAGAVARGWAVAMPSYTLAPEARLTAMTQEIAACLRAAVDRVPGPVVVSGHSAGGHLSARMGCTDLPLLRIDRVVPISPLADLEPLLATGMNATLHIDNAEVQTESPARLSLRPGCQAHVWVGGQERPAFLWQARTLSEAWSCPWTVAPGKHHFNVIDDLTEPNSALVQACIGGFDAA